LTRDVSLKACILDLIDNSIDGYTRNNIGDRREIKIKIEDDKFEIFDTCGGIELKLLEEQVFRFGIEDLIQINRDSPTLGVYGIGLKRSFFKMGKILILETDDGKNHTNVYFDVDEWKIREDWNIHGKTQLSILKKNDKQYTKISIERLHDDVKSQLQNQVFINDITKSISKMYTFFLEHKIDFYFTGEKIEHYPVSVRSSEMLQPNTYSETYKNVNIEIVCFLQPGKGRTKEFDHKGWNVYCNDRLILIDDTSPMTGWSGMVGELPKFHFLYNEFRGFVRLNSNNPTNLPLNTTKTGLILEHPVYRHTLNKMIKLTKPFISYLNKKYPKESNELEEIENLSESEIDFEKRENIKLIPLLDYKEKSNFLPPPDKQLESKVQYISYKKPKLLINKVKKHLGVKTNLQVGSETFDYYVTKERIENETEEV
jgi:hypothetical protein